MRDEAIDLCGQINFTRTDAMPLLERDTQFRFYLCGLRQLLPRAGGYRAVRL